MYQSFYLMRGKYQGGEISFSSSEVRDYILARPSSADARTGTKTKAEGAMHKRRAFYASIERLKSMTDVEDEYLAQTQRTDLWDLTENIETSATSAAPPSCGCRTFRASF